MKDMKRIRKLHPPWSFDLLSAESQSPIFPASCAVLYRKCGVCSMPYLAVCQNLVPLVNIKIAGKWMFIPLKMVLIGIDPYPFIIKEYDMTPLPTPVSPVQPKVANLVPACLVPVVPRVSFTGI